MNKSVVVEFANSISEEELFTLTSMLTERYGGDLGNALEFISTYRPLDQVFCTATSADQVYDLCDELRDALQKECKKREKSAA